MTPKASLHQKGFAILESIYQSKEIDAILHEIETVNSTNIATQKNKGLFALRGFFQNVPKALPLAFNTGLKNVINDIFEKKPIHCKIDLL